MKLVELNYYFIGFVLTAVLLSKFTEQGVAEEITVSKLARELQNSRLGCVRYSAV